MSNSALEWLLLLILSVAVTIGILVPLADEMSANWSRIAAQMEDVVKEGDRAWKPNRNR